MKKFLVMICAAMLCVCCLGLAACGGGSSAASGSASASASSEAAPTFPGEWKLAAVEYQGLTMAGDLSQVMGEDLNINMTIKDDGTGTLVYQGESADFAWTQKDASTITIAPTDNSSESYDATLKDGALSMTAPVEGTEMNLIFTADGTYAGATEIDLSKATAIKSVDELVGTWQLCGMTYMGASLYGDPATLASIAGESDTSITFDKDGKVSLMGSEVSYTVDANGASISESGITLPIQNLNGDIAIDLSSVGVDMVMVFSK